MPNLFHPHGVYQHPIPLIVNKHRSVNRILCANAITCTSTAEKRESEIGEETEQEE